MNSWYKTSIVYTANIQQFFRRYLGFTTINVVHSSLSFAVAEIVWASEGDVFGRCGFCVATTATATSAAAAAAAAVAAAAAATTAAATECWSWCGGELTFRLLAVTTPEEWPNFEAKQKDLRLLLPPCEHCTNSLQ